MTDFLPSDYVHLTRKKQPPVALRPAVRMDKGGRNPLARLDLIEDGQPKDNGMNSTQKEQNRELYLCYPIRAPTPLRSDSARRYSADCDNAPHSPYHSRRRSGLRSRSRDSRPAPARAAGPAYPAEHTPLRSWRAARVASPRDS